MSRARDEKLRCSVLTLLFGTGALISIKGPKMTEDSTFGLGHLAVIVSGESFSHSPQQGMSISILEVPCER